MLTGKTGWGVRWDQKTGYIDENCAILGLL